jgi:hypothetical protein
VNHAALCTLIREQRETTVSRVPIPLCALRNMKSEFSLFDNASDGATWNIRHQIAYRDYEQDMGDVPLIVHLLCFTMLLERKREPYFPPIPHARCRTKLEIFNIRWHIKTGTFEMRIGSHVQLAALRNRDIELLTNSPFSNHGSVDRSTACFRHKSVLHKQW